MNVESAIDYTKEYINIQMVPSLINHRFSVNIRILLLSKVSSFIKVAFSLLISILSFFSNSLIAEKILFLLGIMQKDKESLILKLNSQRHGCSSPEEN